MLVAKNTFLGTFVFHFFVHISLRNLALPGTCWIASRRGTFSFTWLNISSIFSMCMFLLLFLSLLGKGATGLWTCSVTVSLSDICGADWESWQMWKQEQDQCEWDFPLVDLIVHLFSWSKSMNNIALVDLRILNFIHLIGVLRLTCGWLGKVPFGLSLRELANWLIYIFNLHIACEWLLNICPWFCMKAAWDFIKASMLSSNLLNFFSIGGRRKMELDWENSFDDWDGGDDWEILA